MHRGTDILLLAWFLLVAGSFWGPYGIALPANVTTALYALFLVVCIAAGVLRLLKRDTPPEA